MIQYALGVAMAEVARKAIKAYFKEKPKQKSGAEVLFMTPRLFIKSRIQNSNLHGFGRADFRSCNQF